MELETLLGKEKVITGKVVEVDFTNSRILLDEQREVEKSSRGREYAIKQPQNHTKKS